ncbi:hypothetical protein FQV26_01300 [Planococcus sp. CPCC 101016]|uniref:hypothetical protein n=1 Tax=Planococcus sp. CPCC 101016 TaxID=2599617 RepID=UPI0011B5FDE2|nr:hypothetical protein [Planococcus sp. CPCC 101016]TWT06479.1 hypothetical protein FQV26_01300 [Planococcus sp. CPCC 101016]
MKLKAGILATIILLGMSGCSKEKEAVPAENPVNPPIENRENLGETPPALKVLVDGMEIAALRGGYSWSYFDEKENAMVSMEAESLSPQELAKNQKAPSVDADTEIELQFDNEPTAYEVQVWDATGAVKENSPEIVVDDSPGKSIYQVLAHWEQGTGSYVFSITTN